MTEQEMTKDQIRKTIRDMSEAVDRDDWEGVIELTLDVRLYAAKQATDARQERFRHYGRR